MSYQLIHGDCLEVMPTLESGSVDAIITDPPYGIDYQSSWRTDKTQWMPKIINDKKPFISWLPQAFRITKSGGCLLCFCRWDVQDVFLKAIEDVGYTVKSQVVWDKGSHGMGDLDSSFSPMHEIIWFAVKGKYKWHSVRPSSIVRAMKVNGNDLIHPNEKPVSLNEQLINWVSPRNGKILDCFLGSGSSAVASIKTNRNFIGIEQDAGYFQIAQKRCEEATYQPSLFTQPVVEYQTVAMFG